MKTLVWTSIEMGRAIAIPWPAKRQIRQALLVPVFEQPIHCIANSLEAVLKDVEFVDVPLASFKPSHTFLWGDEERRSVVKKFDEFLRDSGKGKVVKIS